MNLSEALNVALPELPTRRARPTVPRLDPAITARDQVEEGENIVIAHRPGTSELIRLTPQQWAVLQLFDGTRSYVEIGEACEQVLGVAVSETEVREFVASLDTANLWYKTPQEKNIALMEKLAAERSRQKKSKSSKIDVAHIQFSAWDPDRFITFVHTKLYWAFSRWFTMLTLCGFAFMTYVFIARWGEIGRDTLQYYTFTEKNLYDLAEFWLLFLVLGFLHESTHALACKHYGGGVHRMGFHLIYLTPAFFVDVTEAWVYANRWQRVATIIAGIWVELIFCAVATMVWWGTPPGTYVHEFSYKVILITGVAVVIVNLNPLIKLDGYYFFSELLDVQGIKERSTTYVSSWVKKHIWRLPVEVEFVPRRLRYLFVPYAILSGLYSYALLTVAVLFAKNIFAKFSPEWAFLPATLLGFYVFRSRLRTLVRFMNSVYLDKREKLLALYRRPAVKATTALVALVLLFAPIWRETVDCTFVLEPAARATLRAEVPGFVAHTHGPEGEQVQAGSVLVELSDVGLQSVAARRRADLQTAVLRRAAAQTRYVGVGEATHEFDAAKQAQALTKQKETKLRLVSPISGVVVTPRLEDRVGSYVEAGTELVDVADLSVMKARIFVPEFEAGKVQIGTNVRLFIFTRGGTLSGTIESISPAPQVLPPGLIHRQNYKGLGEGSYYPAISMVPNEGRLGEGMSGVAKIFVERRSSVGFLWKWSRDFASRKVW